MIRQYKKKPVIIQAIQLTKENQHEVCKFCEGKATLSGLGLMIPTLEGTMFADWGDYVIKGVKGEFYPCKPDVFEMTYDEVENGNN